MGEGFPFSSSSTRPTVFAPPLPGFEAVEIPVSLGAGATETVPIVLQIVCLLETVSVVAEESRIFARNISLDRRRELR